MGKKVFVACKLEEIGLRKLKAAKGLKVVNIPKPSPDELIKEIADSDAIIIKSNVKLTPEVLPRARKLKIICRAGAGVDNVDVPLATQMGIPVTNTPGLNSNAVAELVFGCVHALYKSIPVYDSTTKSGSWEKGKYPIRELCGKTIGIAGLGAIGRRVLEKARGYRMNVKVYDPFVSPTMAEDLGVNLVPGVKHLFKGCDIVTLHMPTTSETKEFVTRETLVSMKKNAVFVNTARATLLAPNALEEALAAHPTLRASVDVHPTEKPGKKPLAKFGDRVLMTPHIGGNSLEAQQGIAELVADTVIDALLKDRLRNLVNFVKVPDELDRTYLDLSESLGRLAAAFSENKGQLEEIRITCYGAIHRYTDILIKPAIKGILARMTPEGVTLINAEAKAAELGVKIVLRTPDTAKNYGESITVDVLVRDKRKACENSVRGKLIEGELSVVRINEFHELGGKPHGHQSFFIYDNKPGVIGCIATLLGSKKINIESIQARSAAGKASRQMLVIRTEQPVPSSLFTGIARQVSTKAGVRVHQAIHVGF